MRSPNLKQWLQQELFEQVPCIISVIDRDYNIVSHNRTFQQTFGPAESMKCYRAYKKRDTPCPDCTAAMTFEDGVVRVNGEVGIDRHGNPAYYIVHMAPIVDEHGRIPYIIEMSTDVTETKKLQKEYRVLFDKVPCYVAVLNRDHRVVRANDRLKETFGVTTGQHCYEMYKDASKICKHCPAEKTFKDGKVHTSSQVGITKDGKKAHYIVTTSPLYEDGSETNHIIEMALDVTETKLLEDKLKEADLFREKLVESTNDALIALDGDARILMVNDAATKLFDYAKEELLGEEPPPGLLPEEFQEALSKKKGLETFVVAETSVSAKDGEEIPVRLSGIFLRKDGGFLGSAAFLQDLRKIKLLEKEKIDAERLAAVGQTVAGLAHGIKNILMGLEGGMYVVNTGISTGSKERIDSGWRMLQRNITKISALVKNMLSFSKGRAIVTAMVNPSSLVREVIELFQDAADQAGIELIAEIDDAIPDAALDPDGIHTCLANLVSNAFDACQMGEKRACWIKIRCYEKNSTLIFEVSDTGCGMDYEIKCKVFTSFFTTKGTEGTGLGLLMTRKIVQEHGGKIELESTRDEGASFRLVFPREHLPEPAPQQPESGA
ncbi:PAS domain S-box protein [Acidobacteriota bacterium]